MKTLANSLKQLRKVQTINEIINGVLIENEVADNATALNRTRIKGLRAVMASAIDAIQAVEFQPPMVIVMSVAAYAEVAAKTEKTVDDYLDNSIMAVSINAQRVPTATPSDDSIVFSAASVGESYDVVMPFTEYEALACGTNFYLVVLGGSFDGQAIIHIEYERVELTDAEYLRYFAPKC